MCLLLLVVCLFCVLVNDSWVCHELEREGEREGGAPINTQQVPGVRCGRGGRPPSRMCAGAMPWFALTPPSGVVFLSGEPVEPFGSVRRRLLTTTVSARCCDSLSFRARNRTAFPGTSLRAGQLAAMHAALRS